VKTYFRKFRREIAAIIFSKWPDSYLVCSEPVQCIIPNTLALDVKVRVLGLEFGWIRQVEIDLSSNTAIIGHFGVDTSMLRRKIGSSMLTAFRNKLISCYGVINITFPGILVGSDRELLLIDLGAVIHGSPSTASRVDYSW